MNQTELKDILEDLHDKYNRKEFIQSDPISIPHSFTVKEDIEISAFLAATLAWGQRPQIIKHAQWFMQLMDNAPYDFVVHASETELQRLQRFYYRTFQSIDAVFFIRVLKHIYTQLGGLELVCTKAYKEERSVKNTLEMLFGIFSSIPHEQRSMKHIANVSKGSAAKRINMFLRWMVRKDSRGVDFGLWGGISSASLMMPLDVHSGKAARIFGLLTRKQNDWKAVAELTTALSVFCKEDPVKYDFSLFGAGLDKLV